MKKIRKNWPKYVLQFGTLAIIIIFLTKIFGNKTADPEAYCPMGGLETLATYFAKGSLACSMTMVQIMMGVMLALGVILFGKLFCGYICPMGLLNELFVKLRRKLKIRLFAIKQGSVLDKILRIIKYALLFVIFYMTLSHSELFCKNFDPYYAFATGFKGELTVWMACISISILFLGSLLVDMFWCRYICPLGALSNFFKFTIWSVALILLYGVLILLGINIPWVFILAAACIMGYLLEILCTKPKLNPQLLAVVRNSDKCNNCGLCEKRCPYHISITEFSKVSAVDCNLCGECVSSCRQDALTITKKKCGIYLPAIIAVLLFGIALYLGNATELPTIDMKWNITEEKVIVPDDQLQSFEMTGMRSVKCFGSSMAFKARLERIPGVYGVKTFVKHGRVVISYDPSVTSEDAVKAAVYTPTKFRISSPEQGVTAVKMITIRTENMYDKMDPNYLGLQIRNSGRKYYGLETEYACPLIVRVYMDMDEPVDEDFMKEMVQMKVLEMPVHGGGVNKIKVNFKYSGMEKAIDTIAIRPYLERMFSPFKYESKSNIEKYAGRSQEIMEFVDMNFEKPLTLRNLPFLSNHLSQQKGIIGVYLVLNEENLPAIRIRYCTDDMNSDTLMSLINLPKWNIQYKKDDIREENARFHFEEKGAVTKY